MGVKDLSKDYSETVKLIRALENRDSCIIWTLVMVPKHSFTCKLISMENEDTLIIRTLLVHNTKVSL